MARKRAPHAPWTPDRRGVQGLLLREEVPPNELEEVSRAREVLGISGPAEEGNFLFSFLIFTTENQLSADDVPFLCVKVIPSYQSSWRSPPLFAISS